LTTDENPTVRAAHRLTTALAVLSGVALLGLMVLTTADVVGRYFFNAPIEGVFDLTQLGMVVIIFFGLAYCGMQGGHVSIEVIYNLLSGPARDVLNRVTNLAGAVLFAVIAWETIVQSIGMRELGETSNLLLIPFYPFMWVVALGSILFALVMLLRVFVPAAEDKDGT
jgi:TRAP-type C4-dicarboxylate transport system permease small subunit